MTDFNPDKLRSAPKWATNWIPPSQHHLVIKREKSYAATNTYWNYKGWHGTGGGDFGVRCGAGTGCSHQLHARSGIRFVTVTWWRLE